MNSAKPPFDRSAQARNTGNGILDLRAQPGNTLLESAGEELSSVVDDNFFDPAREVPFGIAAV